MASPYLGMARLAELNVRIQRLLCGSQSRQRNVRKWPSAVECGQHLAPASGFEPLLTVVGTGFAKSEERARCKPRHSRVKPRIFDEQPPAGSERDGVRISLPRVS